MCEVHSLSMPESNAISNHMHFDPKNKLINSDGLKLQRRSPENGPLGKLIFFIPSQQT